MADLGLPHQPPCKLLLASNGTRRHSHEREITFKGGGQDAWSEHWTGERTGETGVSCNVAATRTRETSETMLPPSAPAVKSSGSSVAARDLSVNFRTHTSAWASYTQSNCTRGHGMVLNSQTMSLKLVGPDRVRKFIASADPNHTQIPDSTSVFYGYPARRKRHRTCSWDSVGAAEERNALVNSPVGNIETLASSANDSVPITNAHCRAISSEHVNVERLSADFVPHRRHFEFAVATDCLQPVTQALALVKDAHPLTHAGSTV